MAEENTQVNVNLTKEDSSMLSLMATQSGYDNRSAFVRWLIRQEWARRNQLIQSIGTASVQNDQ